MIIICKKDLVCDENVQRFTKGNHYEINNFPLSSSINENMTTINDQGQHHKIGIWSKHFKTKK